MPSLDAKLCRFDIYLVLVLRSGDSTILDWKILIGAVGCNPLKLVGAMCARSFSALRPAKLDQWGLAGMNELETENPSQFCQPN